MKNILMFLMVLDVTVSVCCVHFTMCRVCGGVRIRAKVFRQTIYVFVWGE